VWKIKTYPDLIIVCGLREIFEEMNNVLLLKDELQLLSYDTTLDLGNFYVSIPVFQYTLLKEQPCIPAAF